MIRESVAEIMALFPVLGVKGIVFFDSGSIRLLGHNGSDSLCTIEGLEARIGLRAWRKVSMNEALKFCSSRTIKPNVQGSKPVEDADVTWFDDGCAVACSSKADNGYDSDPGINLYCPEWWIYS